MLNMENAEEVMQILERFTRLKQKEIPKELDDYMHYVAKTGDTVFKWSSLKYLFREKLLNVIKNFHETSPRVDDLPQYPNVDPFNYESMKSSLLERLELFNAAPFTVQRLCELLTEPRKQYSRIDKFMRALEKNILVSTIEPGRKQTESENGDSLDSVVNGDVSLDVNVDIEMETETIFKAADTPSNTTPTETTSLPPSSNLIHKSDDDILPNPKKAKLDLDETNSAETEAATKSITINKPETPKPSVEVSMAEDTNDTTEKKQNDEPASEESIISEEKSTVVETVVESIKKDNKVAEPEKMEEDVPTSDIIKETKNVEKSETKDSGTTPEKKEVTPIAASVVEVAKAESEPTKKTVETVDSTDMETEKTEKETIDNNEDSSQKQIIEKTKDVAEKDKTNDEKVQNGNVKQTEVKTETNITTTEKTNDNQSDSSEEKAVSSMSDEKIEDKKEKTVEVPVSVAVVEKEVEAQAVPTPIAEEQTKAERPNEAKTPSKEKPSPTEVKSSPAAEKPALVEEKSGPIEEKPVPVEENSAPADEKSLPSKEKPAPVEEKKALTAENSTELVKEADTAKQAQTLKESPQNESLAKQDEVKPAEAKEKVTDAAAVTDSSVEAPATKEVAVAVSATEKPVVDAPPVEVTPAATLPTVEKSAVTTDVVTPNIFDTPAVVPSSDTAASAETKSEVASATAMTTPTEAVPAAEEPVITADQPMEENPESIAEAEPVVPAIVVEAAATVEEVVMGDSAEMATDAIEPGKDDPAGMEVDDTSQEAMDQ